MLKQFFIIFGLVLVVSGCTQVNTQNGVTRIAPTSDGPTVDLSGCWKTHTSTGTTQLDIVQAGDTISGALSFADFSYPFEEVVFTGEQLSFKVNWVDFDITSAFTFQTLSSEQMEGLVVGENIIEQRVTADRTCN